MSKTNRLAGETSPYLLQHAHNPVDWFPWGEEAFEKARQEDKPVLVSIGYAACHWCHVMERESFEDDATAELMNTHFVNIKVDREERPDVDHIYMDAVQAITGSGGWPLNVFLTPDKKPFYGGTYYPPRRAFNRASWQEVLGAVSQAYREKREEIEQQASSLTEYIRQAGEIKGMGEGQQPGQDLVDQAFGNIMKAADRRWGGFGSAPKFPQTFTIAFLLDYAHLQKNEDAARQALLTLDQMIYGGIHDHIGGGFARYATDTEWLVPHFEKMLYDNALMVMVLSSAWQLSREERYLEAIYSTMDFVEREMAHPGGGFFSALDADSEGVEGKYYIWDHEEVSSLMGGESEIFCRYYDITPQGNWEGSNIPRILKPGQEFAAEHHLDRKELALLLRRGREKLLDRRQERVRPLLDDKILLGWNALMNLACTMAANAAPERDYLDKARKNMAFMLDAFAGPEGLFHHTWKEGRATQPAFLDDYALLVAALIGLGQSTAELLWFEKAREITGTVIREFSDSGELFFYYTRQGQEDILLRKKEIYDGATPSGNAVMAHNLYRLSIIFDIPEWRERALSMVRSLAPAVISHPTSFGHWLSLFYEMASGTREIAIIGPDAKKNLVELLGLFISHKLAIASEAPVKQIPLLAHKAGARGTSIYLCKNYACLQPVSTIPELQRIL